MPHRSSSRYYTCIEMKEEPYDPDVEYVIQMTAPSTLRDVDEETASLIIGMIKEDLQRY